MQNLTADPLFSRSRFGRLTTGSSALAPARSSPVLRAGGRASGWMPPLAEIAAAPRECGIPVLVDAAQLAPHRPLPADVDFLAFSGHKMYAPFGTGALIGPNRAFESGDPFLAGGGAVDLVDLDEVVWTGLPDREEAGSPNVLGAVALGAAAEMLPAIGWERIRAHDDTLAAALLDGLRAIEGVRVLGPGPGVDRLPIATFTIDGVPHALAAARLSAEFAIGVRHGCFCAHPYVVRLLGLSGAEQRRFRATARQHDRSALPGAVRASAGISTTLDEIERLLAAVEVVAHTPAPVEYERDPPTGDYWRSASPSHGSRNSGDDRGSRGARPVETRDDAVDHIVSVDDVAALLVRRCAEEPPAERRAGGIHAL